MVTRLYAYRRKNWAISRLVRDGYRGISRSCRRIQCQARRIYSGRYWPAVRPARPRARNLGVGKCQWTVENSGDSGDNLGITGYCVRAEHCLRCRNRTQTARKRCAIGRHKHNCAEANHGSVPETRKCPGIRILFSDIRILGLAIRRMPSGTE